MPEKLLVKRLPSKSDENKEAKTNGKGAKHTFQGTGVAGKQEEEKVGGNWIETKKRGRPKKMREFEKAEAGDPLACKGVPFVINRENIPVNGNSKHEEHENKRNTSEERSPIKEAEEKIKNLRSRALQYEINVGGLEKKREEVKESPRSNDGLNNKVEDPERGEKNGNNQRPEKQPGRSANGQSSLRLNGAHVGAESPPCLHSSITSTSNLQAFVASNEPLKRKRGRPKKVRPVLAINRHEIQKTIECPGVTGNNSSNSLENPESVSANGEANNRSEEETKDMDSNSCRHMLRDRKKKIGDLCDALKKSEIEQEKMKKENKAIMKRKKKFSGHSILFRTKHSRIVKNSLNHIFYRESLPTSQIQSSVSANAFCADIFQNIYTQLTDSDAPLQAKKLSSTFSPTFYNSEVTETQQILEKQREATLENMKMEKEIVESLSSVKSYINCDLRYFNIDHLIDQAGTFDVVMLDPPWRIKGGQQYDSQFMFANNKFKLEYNTMSNDEILSLRVDKLVKTGFIFLWILANQINVACEMINHWGFELVDIIVWVKLKDGKINLSHGYYFMHSYEICLVGYKSTPGVSLDYRSKISNNIIFAETRKKSQKPDQIYDIIELMFPGSKKIELFARNNNLRPGWFSLGNQLGDQYDSWKNILECNECSRSISIGVKRFKSRTKPDFDICQHCFEKVDGANQPKYDINGYFQLENNVEEEILHEYHRCNNCGCEPIWGTRFSCMSCEEYDLCEVCFDKNLQQGSEKFHDFPDHQFQAFEFPILGHGLPAHVNFKCFGCFQKPIIGACFVCSKCPTFAVCQNCFFTKSSHDLSTRSHKPDHSLEMRLEPLIESDLNFKCISCNKSKIDGNIFKYLLFSLSKITGVLNRCENCFNFYFCQPCYDTREEFMKKNVAHSHKTYHKFMKINYSN